MTAAAPRKPRACPACQGPVRKLRRHAADREFAGMRRYRCRNAGCAWEGLLVRTRRAQPRGRRPARAAAVEQAARARLTRLATALLLAITAAVAGAIFWLRPAPLPFFDGGPQALTGQRHDR